jgi:hypothetical protein
MRQLAQSLVKPAQNATTGADQQRLRGLRSVKWGLLKPVSRPLLLVRLKIVVEENFVLSNTSLDMA